jgi:hypothetical protein
MIPIVERGRPVWLRNWLERHQHPVSFYLHLVGIPLAVGGVLLAVVQLCQWRWALWWRPAGLVLVGYILQIIGHWIEGNDVGEWILVKRLLGRPYTAVSPRYTESDAPPPRGNGES